MRTAGNLTSRRCRGTLLLCFSAARFTNTDCLLYKEEIPEANFLSQVQHNKEVKVSLMDPDFQFLQVKESLTHTRRNLNSLLNADIMMADSPQAMAYRKVATEGSGYARRKDVIIDDEDWVPYGSGSGSGSGDDQEEGEVTSKPVDITTRKPTRPIIPSGSAQATTSLAALLTCVLLCALLDRLH